MRVIPISEMHTHTNRYTLAEILLENTDEIKVSKEATFRELTRLLGKLSERDLGALPVKGLARTARIATSQTLRPLAIVNNKLSSSALVAHWLKSPDQGVYLSDGHEPDALGRALVRFNDPLHADEAFPYAEDFFSGEQFSPHLIKSLGSQILEAAAESTGPQLINRSLSTRLRAIV